MKMTNEQYDFWKKVQLIFAPVAIFLSAICTAFGLPYGEVITLVLSAGAILIGSILDICSKNYTPEEK